MKKIIGITGGIGAGKSCVANLFATFGATVVDADQIAREILEPTGKVFPLVVEHFGEEILTPARTIDRKKLAEIVFHDEQKLELLNHLTHPAVFEEMQRQIKDAKTDIVCLDIPLLFTCEFPIHCDRTLAVVAPKELRIARILERDRCGREQAEARMQNQLSDEEFREKADFTLCNEGDLEILEKKVRDILKQIIKE